MEAKSFLECETMRGKIAFIGLAALLALLVIAAGCLQQQQQQTTPEEKPADGGSASGTMPEGGRAQAIDSFVTCVDAGYPVMESYPRKCSVPDGLTFVEELPEDGQPLPPADGEGKEGAFCGSERGIPCALGFDCQLQGNYPDAGGKCVKAVEAQPPQGNGCTLMRNRVSGEMGCFGCGKTTCIDPIPDFEPYQRQPDEMGIPYACYIDEEGSCALAQ